ncbi:glucose-6-phosphate isomerase [Candidatus Erwinia haradaeae]|uniref:Glucose-6-phosphate isomerase n=1 Tax=Candidatus Erwinia haradaeae TaxID=1922217 RepID=A0A803GCI1_9GAMM|nr:glucose-6-phosphate isomerase [Candidatus Erwinia haradaeae]VFP87769.1 Glucose-6-phosphate isomerase [Candidatus Erwinia haradaeae]
MKNINPIETTAWKNLQKHFQQIKNIKMIDLFKQDAKRFDSFSIKFEEEILLDFSKNIITKETIEKLQMLVKETDVRGAIDSMFFSKKINRTENRAVLHIALRNRKNTPILLDGKDVMIDVNNVLAKMKVFSNRVINGEWKGFTGKSITDVVNIGIGGSDLGPRMVTEALSPYKNHLRMHFLSNIDGTHIIETLKILKPETTLFLIASKTFTTQETMSNAYRVREWFLRSGKERDIAKHFVALSANRKGVNKFGIDSENMFELWDWVTGRYSVWSSIGLSIILSIGFANFETFLSGAYAMDCHFFHASDEKNLPILLALISIWYNNFFGSETEAILPYDHYMRYFSNYIQQNHMESNGKCMDRAGKIVSYQTGSIIWGDIGTNGQHAFYQLMHQGTKLVPCDFIAPVISHNKLSNHHDKLISNFLAQTEALAFGQSVNLIEREKPYLGQNFKLIKDLTSYQQLNGNRPTNSILIRCITPYSLGLLMALYEHKVFTQGVILNIFSFDQWGVELGKKLANRILSELSNVNKIRSHDSSTNGLMNTYKSWR